MSKLLLIYAAVIFIAAVILFTYSEIKKGTGDEPEIYKWMRVFSIILLVMAIASFIASRMSPA